MLEEIYKNKKDWVYSDLQHLLEKFFIIFNIHQVMAKKKGDILLNFFEISGSHK